MNIVQPFTPSNANIPVLNRYQAFTASGSFTAPLTGQYLLYLKAGGGAGGNGGGTLAGDTRGGLGGMGGGEGDEQWFLVNLTAGTNYPFVVGAGAAQTAAQGTGLDGSDGAQGGNTVFNGVQTVTGGRPGRGGNLDGSASGSGQCGETGHGPNSGLGAPRTTGNASGADAGQGGGYGSGGGGGAGGGAGASATSGGRGGAGASGLVLLIW